MTINNNPNRPELTPIIGAIVEFEDFTSSNTNIQNVDNKVAKNDDYLDLQDMEQGETETIEEGYIIGNIVQRSQEVFHMSVPTPIKERKSEGRRALEALKRGKKTKMLTPQLEMPIPQLEHLCLSPSSLRIDLWQFGKFVEKQRDAEEKYLKDFNDDERHFLKQQLGQIGQHFNSFKEYQDAEKLRESFDKRLLANDPPPPSKQRVEYLAEEIKILNEEIKSATNELLSLTKSLNTFQGDLNRSKKNARTNILQGKITTVEEQIDQQNKQLVTKKTLLSKKQDLLLQMESNNSKIWSPHNQLEKDNARRNKLYGIPNIEEEQAIAQLKKIGALRKDLYGIKRSMDRENGKIIAEKITQAAVKLTELAKELKNDSVISQVNKTLELPQSEEELLKALGNLLSQMYQQYFLQGRKAPHLYKNQKNKDDILVAFKDRFGEKRFAEVSKQLQSFLQEISIVKQPLEIVKPGKIIENLSGIDLSERKVSEFPFYRGTLLDKDDEEINRSKASHTLVVDTYLKNRLPFTIINLLQIDSSPEFTKLFPDKKMGATQVRFFFGTLNQAIAHYCPNSIAKISGGGSEFYLFETYENRIVQVVDTQEKREECWRFYNYYLLVFDVPSIESLEHQLYQLRYAGIRVQNMIVKGNLETFTREQVKALTLKAKTYLDAADREYGRAMRVFLLGNTRLMLTAIGQYLKPGLDKDAAFEALEVQYITPKSSIFNLNYTRIDISNPGRGNGKSIPVALLALRMPNGSLAGKVTYALLTQAGVKYITTIGAGGSINYETPIGNYEFISKSYTYDHQRKLKQVNLSEAYKQGRVLIPPKTVPNTNITVSGPLFETEDWLNNAKKGNFSNVDVESWHIMDAYNQAINFLSASKNTAYITPSLFMSDHVGKEDASLSKIIGKAAYKNNYLLAQFVAQQIRELHSPYSPPTLFPLLFATNQYLFNANTLYTSPGTINARPVSIPIADISNILLTEKNLGQIFQLINTATINRPYDSEELDIELPYFSETTRLTAYRPNHNGTHSARQARLLEATFTLIKNHGSDVMQEMLENLPSKDKLALELAAYCLRIGRCDESGWKLDGDDYNSRSAEIFTEYAKQLKIDPKTIDWLAKRIRYSTFDDERAEIKDPYDRFAHAMLSLVHELDLVRIFPADKFKNKVNKHLQTLLPQTINPEQYANSLINFSQDLSIVTGGTLGNARAPFQQEAEFTICSTYGDHCWKAVKNIPLPSSLEPKNARSRERNILVSSSNFPSRQSRKPKATTLQRKSLPKNANNQQKNTK